MSAGGIAFHNRSLGYGGSTYFTRAADGTLISGRPLSGGSSYYLYDGLGSVMGLTDASGALIRSTNTTVWRRTEGRPRPRRLLGWPACQSG